MFAALRIKHKKYPPSPKKGCIRPADLL